MKTPLDTVYTEVLSEFNKIPQRATDYERGKEDAYSEVLNLIESLFSYEKNQIQCAFNDGGENYDKVFSRNYYHDKYENTDKV